MFSTLRCNFQNPVDVKRAHDAIIAGRPPGLERHKVYVSPDDPAEFLVIDEWASKEDMDRHFANQAVIDAFAGARMEREPEVLVWDETDWLEI